ncbi:MAG TPA: ParB/RepB/Spo0J family partition protein [Dermatophilaceae bacterium]|nr:ParB/RepB/Spo0J family partition protein [Dermatophilaceae bacterium]
MSDKRRALGRGLGALIPTGPAAGGRPVDVFFRDQDQSSAGFARPDERDSRIGSESGSGSPSASNDGSLAAPADDGTGLSGLAPVPGATFAELDVRSIRPNPRQPRTVFDEDDMAELVHSVREIGILQPVVVRPIPEAELDPDTDTTSDSQAGAESQMQVRYELIMGERRWRAAQAAGLAVVPAIIKATADDDLLRDALLENLHRSQLNPLEEAAAYQQLLDDFGCTQEQLAARIGRSRPQVTNTLRLLKLPPIVARRVAAGVLSAGHARALLGLTDGAAMERLAQRIVAEGLSVRSVEEIVAIGAAETKAAARKAPRPGHRRPQLDDLAARLGDHFDTRVAISLGQRKGKITIEFASVDDLHRIVDVLGVDRRG